MRPFDDRVWCKDCAHLSPPGACRVALRGERKDVLRDHYPPQYLPSHCVFFAPKPGAEDQRSGKERFVASWSAYAALHGVPAVGEVPTRIRELRKALESS